MNPLGKTYTLPTKAVPSWQNIEGGIGLFAGMFVGLATLGPVAAVAFAAGGAFFGGSIGRARMQEEFKHGRQIHSPYFFNKTALAGTLVGLCAATILVPLLFPGLPLMASVAAATMIAGGSIIGSTTEYFKQRTDFARAKERSEIAQMKQVERDLGLGIAPAPPQKKRVEPSQELPEFADRPTGTAWSQRAPRQDLKPGAKQPDFRSLADAPQATGKGGIA